MEAKRGHCAQMADFGAGPGDSGGTRGVYWKRNDSMRLVHLLIDRELKALALFPWGPRAFFAFCGAWRGGTRVRAHRVYASSRQEAGQCAPD